MKANVCIVDDDASVQRALRRLLQAAGYRVFSCLSAEEFLDLCHLPRPLCLLVDLRMPGMTGADLQVTIAGTSREAPFVLMSGHADLAAITRVKMAGAVACLTKPVEADELLDAVETAIEKDRRSQASSIPFPIQSKS